MMVDHEEETNQQTDKQEQQRTVLKKSENESFLFLY
jgi:hypothetical protein